MHFLLDANLPRNLVRVIQRAGYECTHLGDTSLAAGPDAAVAALARSDGLTLVTRDFDFADIRAFPPEDYAGIVVFELPGTATAALICALGERFFGDRDMVNALPKRLAIVDLRRVRLRLPLSEH